MRIKSRSNKAKKKPFVIAMVGAVGSGKTYVAKRLARALGAVHIQTDAIRVSLRKQGRSFSRAPALAKARAKKMLSKGGSVIFDSDFVNSKKRRDLLRWLKQFHSRVYFVRLKTPEQLILARLARKRYSAEDLFQNAAQAIRVYFFRKKFHEKPGRFTPSFTIDNSKPVGPQLRRIASKIAGR